jgi:diguanylate cyclase (GGDEF)-like protein
MQTDFSALLTERDVPEFRRAGDVIFEAGEPGRVMYVVKSGQAQIRIGDMVLDLVESGEVMGEMALLDDDVRSAGAVAATDCEIVAVDKARLLEWVRERPEVAIELGKAMVRRLRKMTTMAQYDALTQLPNRVLFHELCNAALMRAERRGTMVATLFVDLDHFKTINESLGYAAGDRLLVQVAGRLRDTLHELDNLARLGADEFAVVLEEAQSEHDLAATAQRLLQSLAEPFRVEGHEIFVAASIGVSCYPRDGETAQSLLKNADTAMRLAKTEGRGRFQFFAPELNALAVETLVMTNHLRQALDRGELFLNFQPRIDIGSGKIVGSEALLRWKHPEHGLVSPAKFVPLAERAGLIERIGEWVLRSACVQQQAWLDSGFPPFQIAVNLSVQQLRQADLPQRVAAILDDTGLQPEFLELEVTESLFMEDGAVAKTVLADLRAMGVSIALDDFGTGYSSLSYLQQFPLDYLKIDQSFMRGVPDKLHDVAIAKTIVTLAKTLGLREIAEGVETERQLEFLKTLGCEQFQGYLFSRPLAAADMLVLLKSNLGG